MRNKLSNSEEKPGALGAIIGFFNSWGGRIGIIVGIAVRIIISLIGKDDFDGNLLVTIMFVVICGLAGATIGKIVIFVRKLIKI
ncbi:hypothetical protein FACS189456_3000 [Bacteroidia bacterium]|nr:hypothetical protein FACS189456_3000 [Bacteroidia bacterium]